MCDCLISRNKCLRKYNFSLSILVYLLTRLVELLGSGPLFFSGAQRGDSSYNSIFRGNRVARLLVAAHHGLIGVHLLPLAASDLASVRLVHRELGVVLVLLHVGPLAYRWALSRLFLMGKLILGFFIRKQPSLGLLLGLDRLHVTAVYNSGHVAWRSLFTDQNLVIQPYSYSSSAVDSLSTWWAVALDDVGLDHDVPTREHICVVSLYVKVFVLGGDHWLIVVFIRHGEIVGICHVWSATGRIIRALSMVETREHVWRFSWLMQIDFRNTAVLLVRASHHLLRLRIR